MRKKDQRKLITGRLNSALSNMYHNATPRTPLLDTEEYDEFDQWFNMIVEQEFYYINSGGPHGFDGYIPLYAHIASLKKVYPGYSDRWYAVKRRSLIRKYNCDLKYVRACEIVQYGKVYSWGRGGRTVAPIDMISRRGGSSYSIKQFDTEDMSLEKMVDMILVVEAFNEYVREWNESIPAMWADDCMEKMIEEEDILIMGMANFLESSI